MLDFGKIKNFIIDNLAKIIIVMAVCLALLIFQLVNSFTGNNRFYRAAARAVEKGWDQELNEYDLQQRDADKNASFFKIEYDAIKSYENLSFSDASAEKIAEEYLTALKECIVIAEKIDPNKDFDKFWNEMSEPYGKRLQALYKIYKKKRNSFAGADNKYPDEFKELVTNGWALNTTKKIKFKKLDEDRYKASIKNTSGYDLVYYDIDVALLDKKGKTLETTNAHVENIKNGERKNLIICKTKKDVVAYKIISERCETKNEEK